MVQMTNPRGRCAGCSHENTLRKIRNHTSTCAEFLALYQADPAAVLAPEDEYVRAHSPEAKAEKIVVRDAKRISIRTRLQEVAVDRHAFSRQRWSGFRPDHDAVHVEMPVDGVLVGVGATEAQRALSQQLGWAPLVFQTGDANLVLTDVQS